MKKVCWPIDFLLLPFGRKTVENGRKTVEKKNLNFILVEMVERENSKAFFLDRQDSERKMTVLCKRRKAE